MTRQHHAARTHSRIADAFPVCDAESARGWEGPHRRRFRIELGPAGVLVLSVLAALGCAAVVNAFFQSLT